MNQMIFFFFFGDIFLTNKSTHHLIIILYNVLITITICVEYNTTVNILNIYV